MNFLAFQYAFLTVFMDPLMWWLKLTLLVACVIVSFITMYTLFWTDQN